VWLPPWERVLQKVHSIFRIHFIPEEAYQLPDAPRRRHSGGPDCGRFKLSPLMIPHSEAATPRQHRPHRHTSTAQHSAALWGGSLHTPSHAGLLAPGPVQWGEESRHSASGRAPELRPKARELGEAAPFPSLPFPSELLPSHRTRPHSYRVSPPPEAPRTTYSRKGRPADSRLVLRSITMAPSRPRALALAALSALALALALAPAALAACPTNCSTALSYTTITSPAGLPVNSGNSLSSCRRTCRYNGYPYYSFSTAGRAPSHPSFSADTLSLLRWMEPYAAGKCPLLLRSI